MPEIIFDCCCISNFALSGSLFVLENLYSNSAYITNFVNAEIIRGIQQGQNELIMVQKSLEKGWPREANVITQKEKSLYETLSVSLGLGEASSVGVARSRGFIFASDDRAARREAGLLEVKLTGTIGILKKAVEHDIIKVNEGNLTLTKMIETGFYSPIHDLKKLY